MKKSIIFALMAAVLMLGSCVDSKLDPLSGDFLPAPTVVKFTKLDKSDATKDANGRWIFTLDLSDDASNKMHAVIVGNKYYLGSNTYSEAPDANAKNGNFIAGQTTVNGIGVRQGNITVREAAPDYTLSAVLFLEDGSPYKVEWTGQIVYEEPAVLEPEYTYSDETSGAVDETFAPVAGVTTHNLTLKDKSGDAKAWFQLVLTEGVSDFSGEYVCKEYAHEDHTFGNGYDLSMYGMGLGGTRYVDDGGNTVLVQTGETLTITSMGDGVYSIEGSTGYSFLCAPEGFVPGGGEVYTITDETAGAVDETFAPVAGVTTHNLTLKDKDGEDKVWFQLVLTEGSTEFEGDYVCKEYAHEDHTFGNGYDLSMYGMGLGGTRYVTPDGETVLVQPGETLTVTKVGEDTYKFTGSTGYEFTGKFEGGTPGPGPGPGPEDTFDYTPGAAYSAANNLWKPVDAAKAVEFFSYMNIAADWSNPKYDNVAATSLDFVEFKESTYKLTLEDQTFDRWQNQLYIHPYGAANYIALDPAKTYKFSVTLQSTEAFGAFFKLSKYNPDGAPKYEGEAIWEPEGYPDNVVFEAGKPVVFEKEISGAEAPNINLIFDFGKNPAGTVVYIKDITIVEQGGETPGVDAVELKEFLSLTDYGVYGMKMVGLELGTPGFYYTPADWVTTWSPSYPVDGQFIKLEVYSEDGTVAPGTYVPSAVNGTVNPGEFNLGADNGWGGFNGTSWFTVASGAASGVAVTDGTVTVAKDGDVYTIEIKTSAVNAKYVGKLSAGGDTPADVKITVDGDMSDWAGVTGTVLEPSGEEGVEGALAIAEVKGFVDADNVYVYVKRVKLGRWTALWGGESKNAGYYYYNFDLDNNPETGDYPEHSNGNYEAWTYLYLFGGSAEEPAFRVTPPGSPQGMSIDNVKCFGTTTADAIEVEIAFPRADLPAITADQITVGVWGNKDGNPYTKVTFPAK